MTDAWLGQQTGADIARVRARRISDTGVTTSLPKTERFSDARTGLDGSAQAGHGPENWADPRSQFVHDEINIGSGIVDKERKGDIHIEARPRR